MTIKQLGGVFGRNPTFNDVTIEGELTFDGDIDINSDLKIDGNLEVTGTSTLNNLTTITKTSGKQLSLVGWSWTNGGNGSSGALELGPTPAYQAQIGYAADGNTTLSFDNTYSSDSAKTQFRMKTAGTAVVPLTIYGSGNVELSNNLVMASGQGIDFSATAGTGTSELLDDYEEGTWTPTFQGTTSGSISFASEGYYTKIGRMVMASFYLTSKDFSAAAIVGTLEIAGLPFNVAILGQGLGNLAVNNFIAGASDYVPYAYSTDRLRVSKGNTSTVTDADLTQSASRAIAVSITYMSS